jgi:hypothetical protein
MRPLHVVGGGGDVRASLADRLCSKYGFAPDRAEAVLGELSVADLELIPLLLAKLDVEIEERRVKNPAGLLVSRLRAFGAWKPSLEAERAAADAPAAAEVGEQAASELELAYMREVDEEARASLARMTDADREILADEVRRRALERSGSARKWTEAEWRENLGPLLLAAVRAESMSFAEWLERRQSRPE